MQVVDILSSLKDPGSIIVAGDFFRRYYPSDASVKPELTSELAKILHYINRNVPEKIRERLITDIQNFTKRVGEGQPKKGPWWSFL